MPNLFQKAAIKFRGVWRDSENLNHRAARSGAIVFGARVLTKGIQLVRTVVLARLLFPHDFGLFGMASLSLGLLDTFLQTGMNASVIQEKEDVKRYLNSAWTFNVLRNTFVAVLVFLSAPYFGSFFENEIIIPFIQVLSLSIFIAGFENIGIVLFQRELRYNKKFYFDTAIVLTEVLSAIILAFVLRSPWALVLSTVLYRLAGVIFSFIIHPYRPRFEFDWAKIKHLLGFGKWVGFMAIVGYLVSQGDNLAVGKLLGSEQLGYYQLAFGLGIFPAIEIARVLGGVLFPLFSRIRHDAELLRRTFITSSRLIFSVTIPASLGILILSPHIVRYIYGERWLPMVPILSIIVVYGLFKSVEYVLSPLLLGMGRSKLSAFSSLMQFAVMFSLILPFAKWWGTVGVAWSVLVGGFVAQSLFVLSVRKEINLGLAGFFEIIQSPLVCGLIMYLVLNLSLSFWAINSLPLLLLYVGSGALIYFAFLYLFDKWQGQPIYQSLLWIKKSL